MKRLASVLLLAMALGAAPAVAADLDRCFYPMDADGNDLVDKAELVLVFPDEAALILAEADTDGDGHIGHEEWEAFKLSRGIVEDHE